MKRHIIATLALLAAATAGAQYNEANNLFYHSFRMPQSNMQNPALFPMKTSVYLQLPELDLRFGFPKALSDFIHVQGDTLTVININDMLDAQDGNSAFRLGVEANLLGAGVKIRDAFVTFNTRLVSGVNVGLPMGTVGALLHGNMDDDGNAINEVTFLDGDLLNVQAYLETSIGAGYCLRDLGLTLGARAKLLYGIANLQTDNTRLALITDDNYEKLKVDMYYQLQMSTAVPLEDGNIQMPSVSEMLNIFDANTGLAFDLGARYDMGPFTFSVAINDISRGIHWDKNVMTVAPQGGRTIAETDGVNVTNLIMGGNVSTDSISNYWQQIVNNMLPDTTHGGDGYYYAIPTKINLGASFSFAKMLRAGLLFHGQLDRGLFGTKSASGIEGVGEISNTFRFNTTLSLAANLFSWAEVAVGSSVVYDGSKVRPFNPGFSLVLTPAKTLQFYLAMDYMSSIYIVDSRAFHLRTGLNLLFGKGKHIVKD